MADGEHNLKKLRSTDGTAKVEECSDTEPETYSDSDTEESSGSSDWEDSTIEGEDGDEPIIIKEDEAGVFGAIMLQLSLKQGL